MEKVGISLKAWWEFCYLITTCVCATNFIFSELHLFHAHSSSLAHLISYYEGRSICNDRVATVREKVLENEKFSRSGKSQGITFSVREI